MNIAKGLVNMKSQTRLNTDVETHCTYIGWDLLTLSDAFQSHVYKVFQSNSTAVDGTVCVPRHRI
jgi:hypothetical protein